MDGWMDGKKKESEKRTAERGGCVGQYILSQSRELWDTPAPVTMETKRMLFHVSCLVAHGNCPEIEG